MPTLKEELLPLIDELRALPGELGFHPYEVWVRVTTWSGSRVGLGTSSSSDTQLLVGGQNPKVREVHRKDVVAGTTASVDAEYDIGPITPEFAGGGVAEAVVNPPKTTTPTEVFFLLKGPGTPDNGILCERVGDHVDHVLRITIRVQSTGRQG